MHHLVLQAPHIAATACPGQFVALALPGVEPLLPRPFDLHYADPETGQIEIVFRVKGRGTQLLAALPQSSRLQVQGPFGNPIGPLLEGSRNIAVIGRGAGISPLSFIARRAFDHGARV
ncbi:MAG TPA: FAD-binding oxidoreductase, partial [Trueperaceae bacterium]